MRQALKLVEDGEYDKATEIFTKLGEYEDCRRSFCASTR